MGSAPDSRSTSTPAAATISEVLLDSYFQPGKLPDSLSDYLKGLIAERLILRPKTP